MSREEIFNADREALVSYLESWGFACYDHEPVEELRIAALLNHQTERTDGSSAHRELRGGR